MTSFVIVAALAILEACAIVALLVVLDRVRSERAFALELVASAKREAMAAEARSRGVGGTGEHGAPVVTALEPISRTWTMGRDPRWTIPSDRRA